MKKQSKIFQRAGMALLMSFSTSALLAAEVANEQVDSGGLTLTPTVSYDSATLRVSSDSSESTSSFNSGEALRVDTGSLNDGVYYYELSLSSVTTVDDGSGTSSAVSQNGKFRVSGGVASEFNDDIANAEAEAESDVAQAVAAANAATSVKND